jgi:predicted metalloprotease with PDZ domain
MGRGCCGWLLCAWLIVCGSTAKAQTIGVFVDAQEANAQRVAVRVTIQAKPGGLTLQYPRWVPGAHGPVGPLRNVANLRLFVGEREIPWQRDAYDPFTFRCEVPPGATTVTANFDYLPRKGSTEEVSYGVAASDKIAIINWGALLLYPQGQPTRIQTVSAQLRIPQGWKHATALTTERQSGDTLNFAPVSLETIVDSPVFVGLHSRTVRLDEGKDVPHYLNLFADSEEMLGQGLTPALLESLQRLVAESGAMFGARHYRQFRFLLAVSNQVPVFGLEHHECSVNVLPPFSLGKNGTLDNPSWWYPNLLPHEFVHSWNGKHRRPQGLTTESFNGPHSTDLLWVYEGLTEYLGEVLMVRAGFRPATAWYGDLLQWAVGQGNSPGRTWQTLGDVATAYPLIADGGSDLLRTTNDVYFEGELLWLEVDTRIRRQTGGRKSLDDFCRIFFGGANTAATVRPYTRRDVVSALNAVLPGDWDEFLDTRLNARGITFLSAGLENAGWRIRLTDDIPPNRISEAQTNYRYSLGFTLASSGTLLYLIPDSMGAKAGMQKGMQIAGVNGKRFSPAVLRDAVRASKEKNAIPIELLVFHEDRYRTFRLEYHGGEKIPVLERIENTPDGIAAIAAPRLPIPLGPPPPTQN